MDRDVLLRFLDETENTDYAPGHPMLTYSAEGFKELFFKVRKALTGKDKYGVKPGDAKPGVKIDVKERWTPTGLAAVEELKTALKKYYLNDHWLSAQTFVEGDIKADDFSKVFEVDGKVGDPFKNIELSIQRVIQYAGKVKPLLKQLDDRVQALNDGIARTTKGADLDDRGAVAKVEAVIKEFKDLAKFAERAPKFPGTVLGNRKLTTTDIRGSVGFTVTVARPPKGVDRLPALDKEGVKKAAQLIMRCYDYNNPLIPDDILDFEWLDHSDGSDFNEWIYDAANDVYMEYYEIFYHQEANRLWVEPITWMLPEYELASALERWIDRSLK